MQHALKHVERPGGSHTALDGKKNAAALEQIQAIRSRSLHMVPFWSRWCCQRWQTAGGGSNPCWSTRESQVRPAKRQRAPTTKKSTWSRFGDRHENGWWLLGKPFWAKPVLRSFFEPRIGSVGASCFVDDFVSCWGQARCISVAAWTYLKLASYISLRLVAWLAERRPISLLQPVGDCLRCFLLLRSLWVFAQVAGFHLNDCIEYSTAPCWPPLPI